MKVFDFIRLTRPFNGLMVFLCVFAGAFSAGSNFHINRELILISIVSLIVTLSANIINDYFDLEIDMINRPQRPLPSNKISPVFALYISIFLFFLSFFISSFLNWKINIIVFLAVIISFFYTPIFKRIIFIKNFTVAINVAFAFLCGGLAVNSFVSAIPMALFAFFISIFREIMKDIYDFDGDKRNNIFTLPVKLGKKRAWLIANAFLLVLLIAIFYFYFFYQQNIMLLIFMLVLVIFPIFIFSYIVFKKHFEENSLFFALRIFKIFMFLGLLLFFI